MDELHDQQLKVLGVAAQGLIGRLHPGHIAVVVGTPHVDLAIEAALALVLVVGDVRGEVGVLAAGANQHAVLVVAEFGGAQPQRALAPVGMPLSLEDRQRAIHRARVALVQGALICPAIEALDRECGQRRLHLLHHHAHRGAANLGGIDRVLSHQVHELLNVCTPVAVLGNRLIPCHSDHRLAELTHLRAGVVDVELTLHLVTAVFKKTGQSVTVGGIAGMTHVHRPGRVGGHELDQNPLARQIPAGIERRPRGKHIGESRDQPRVGEKQVEKSRPGNLESLKARAEPRLQGTPEKLGNLAGGGVEASRQEQGGIGRVVPEIRARRTLEGDVPTSRNRGGHIRRGAGELSRSRQHGSAQAIQRRGWSRHGALRSGSVIVGMALGHRSSRGDCDTSCVNDQDSGAERHINIHLSPEIMGGVYANFANVSHSDYEFTVTFARVDHEVESEEVPGVVVSRVNLSPRFMRELIDAMEDNYSKWRTREGIKNLPEYGGTEAGSKEE